MAYIVGQPESGPRWDATRNHGRDALSIKRRVVHCLSILAVAAGSAAQNIPVDAAVVRSIPAEEYIHRRHQILARLSDGIVLLHARSTASDLTDHGFKQDASYFYFTGESNRFAAVLALDGPMEKSFLFVPDGVRSFGTELMTTGPMPGEPSSFDDIRPWRDLLPYLRERASDGVSKLYLDEARRAVMPGNPEGMLPMAGERNLWWRSVSESMPEASLVSAAVVIREMRWTKTDAEVAALREVARASASALLAGMRVVEPGVRQRVSEAAVVSGCIEAGAEGPSFWPWTMSGPNAHGSVLGSSFHDYRHLDRVMERGELVRMDIGCDLAHYEGDVGRTIPVSGTFSAEQAEAWGLLVAGYRAGLDAIRPGASRAELAEASRAAVQAAQASLRTDYAREASRVLLEGGDAMWHVHGVGLEAGEERMPKLTKGTVLAYEPGFSVGDDAYYLEDMILVTARGHEVLSSGLPYSAQEIEAAMASAPSNR